MSDLTYEKIPGDNFFRMRSDGVRVHNASREVRDAMADGRAPAATGAPPRKPKPRKPQAPTGDRVTLEGPEKNEGRPRRPPPGSAPDEGPTRPSASSRKEADVIDFKELIAGVYAGMASLTQWPGWLMSEPECDAIARPLARIVGRNRNVHKVVQQVADPVSLAVAVAVPTGVRYFMWRDELRARSAQPVHAVPNPPRSQPPPPSPAGDPTTNGRAAEPTASAIDRLRNMP